MKGYQCKSCQFQTMSNIAFCPKCHKQTFAEITVPSEGTVYSFTTIRVAPPQFAGFAPYQIALVALNEQLHVTAFIQEEVNIGDKVVFKELRDKAYVFERWK